MVISAGNNYLEKVNISNGNAFFSFTSTLSDLAITNETAINC
jgi:hypothetical protein